jgi:hypothetical protein
MKFGSQDTSFSEGEQQHFWRLAATTLTIRGAVPPPEHLRVTNGHAGQNPESGAWMKSYSCERESA